MKTIHFKNKFSQLYLLNVLGIDNMNERKNIYIKCIFLMIQITVIRITRNLTIILYVYK